MAKSKLAFYQQKRDFTKTAEPSGRAKIAPAEYPRFRHPEARGDAAAL